MAESKHDKITKLICSFSSLLRAEAIALVCTPPQRYIPPNVEVFIDPNQWHPIIHQWMTNVENKSFALET